ncbi:MAG: bifunctional demethylmenaquinone methyltransferase/2-methoxy-6-polyprenyl-1,4-benzoquinol methylase UbiE [Halofilum sp. (in: g-proteobacteria)]|nr:bifunctional demethylmenaquinone methyltransferase/2-methoxy-6-polyprenyl-1,4-benzoquinol methylase UbiE [Halofilum sp. (in: g-proteobacteria)]
MSGETPTDPERGDRTHFGFDEVPVAEKARRVGAVFDSVASRYDLMNDLMSGGLHRLWKRFTLARAGTRPGESVLDLATGSGDLALGHARGLQGRGRLLASDINASMLARGRDRLIDAGPGLAIDYVQADAQALPFADRTFDCVTIGFGLRNVTDQAAALAEMTRVLRPGGRLVILEFSQPAAAWFRRLYDTYSFQVLPRLGAWVAGDAESYRYLAESIRMHPDQQTLAGMMADAGLVRCDWNNLTGGVVAVHKGYRP